MATVSVRYIVHDVDAAIGFYCGELGFEEVMHPAPAFAMLSHGDLRLVLSAPGGGPGGGAAMPDGTVPEPGGWNRFSLEVPDIEATVERLRTAGVRFRNDIVTGVGGKQILVEDPSGNPRRAVRADPRRSPARPPSRLRPRTTPEGRSRTLAPRRDVAQPGSAPALGAGGREFESRRPDLSHVDLPSPTREDSSAVAPHFGRLTVRRSCQ